MVKRSWRLTFFMPLILLYLWLIGGGLILVIAESLGFIPALGMTDISLIHYASALKAEGFLRDFLYSLYIALTASTLSVAMGTYLAYRLVRSRSAFIKAAVTRCLQLGLVLPYLYMVFIVTLLFSRTGIYARIMTATGLINGYESFPVLIQEPLGIGIILVYLLKGLPFVTLFVMNIMAGISPTYEQAAKSLGASSLQILRRIYLPLCSDTIVWSLMVLVAYDLGAFEVPYLLGSQKPQSLSIRLFSAYMSPQVNTIPMTMAIAVLLFVIGFAVVAAYGFIIKRLLISRRLMSLGKPSATKRPDTRKTPARAVEGVLKVLFLSAVGLPIFYILLLSVHHFFRFPLLLPTQFTLSYWKKLLMTNTLFWGSLGSSILVAGLTAILATLVGFMAGRGIALYFKTTSSRMLLIVSLPLFIPGMSLFMGAHQALIHSPLVNHSLGVVLAHTLICIPYTTNIATAYFKGIPLELEQTAKSLGSSWRSSFRRLVLPMIRPGLALSLTIAFLISNTEYFATFLIGGGRTITLSMIMYPYIANSDYGMSSATGLVFILLHLAVFLLLDRLLSGRNLQPTLYGRE